MSSRAAQERDAAEQRVLGRLGLRLRVTDFSSAPFFRADYVGPSGQEIASGYGDQREEALRQAHHSLIRWVRLETIGAAALGRVDHLRELRDFCFAMASHYDAIDDVRSFAWALYTLKSGGRVARAGWNGKGMWLALQVPDAHSKMSLPYIYMRTADGHLVPWLASQTDMLAEDWFSPKENDR